MRWKGIDFSDKLLLAQ
jgi:hydroxymethylglutaryl-CoA reductase